MTDRMNKALVTGGSGFIGGQLIKLLASKGVSVLSVDKRTLSESVAGVQAIEADIRNAEELSNIVSSFQPDYVFHLAAYASIHGGEDEMWSHNVQGTRNLIEALTPGVKRVMFTSTQLAVSMYGDAEAEDTYDPYTYYGETKAEMERLIRAQCQHDWVIVRPTNIWGPHHPSFGKSIFKYLKAGLYLHPVKDRPIVRSYGYVENCAHQMYALALAPEATGRVLYATDEPMDSADYLDAFSMALRGSRTRRVPASALSLLGRIGDLIPPLPLDSGRVERMTNDYVVPYQRTLDMIGPPPVEFQTGVDRTVDWLKAYWSDR